MDEELLEKAEAFARAHGGSLGEALGSGIHGTVVVLKSESGLAGTALKIHFSAEPYRRESEVYERLRETGIRKILGFNVPQLLRRDDELLAVEMTIVPPSFVLDFAGAWLDWPPEFSDEIWAERRESGRASLATTGRRRRRSSRNSRSCTFTCSIHRRVIFAFAEAQGSRH